MSSHSHCLARERAAPTLLVKDFSSWSTAPSHLMPLLSRLAGNLVKLDTNSTSH